MGHGRLLRGLLLQPPMTARRPLSPMRRLRVFEAAGGLCHLCGLRIQVGEKWEVEHRRALALGGEDDDANLSPAHKSCHAEKTTDDLARTAKAKRMKAKHLGIRKRSTFPKPPPGYEYDWRRRGYFKAGEKA
jgi:5-methylcytosine-specific restriction protein A